MNTKLIAYYRVSTKQQGQSGLGLEAQEATVKAFASQAGDTIIARYTEVESGKRADRPELAKAVAHARRSKAKLVIAKLDRLARNVAFLSALMDSGVEIVAVDNPYANRLTIHILAAVAEDEARRTSERTKAALAAAKARGMKLGSSRPGAWAGREDKRLAGLVKARQAAAQAKHGKALEAVADLLPAMQAQRAAGATLDAIAQELNKQGQQTSRGCPWSAMAVYRALKLAQKAR